MQETLTIRKFTSLINSDSAPIVYPDSHVLQQLMLKIKLMRTTSELNKDLAKNTHMYHVELKEPNGEPLYDPVKAKKVAPEFFHWTEGEKEEQNPSALQELHRLMNLYFQTTSSTGNAYETYIPQGGLSLRTTGKYHFNGVEIVPPITYLAAQINKYPKDLDHAKLLTYYGWQRGGLDMNVYQKERAFFLPSIRETFLPPGTQFSVSFY